MPQLTIYLLLLPFILLSQNFPTSKKFRLPKELPEASGLHIAAPDSLWWLNDSGNAPLLYCTDGNGNLRRELKVGEAANRDWEDLAADDTGHLYIGDFGNNDNQRQDLCIYIFQPGTGALDSIQFRYPDQAAFPPEEREDWTFDMEGFFYHQDSLHLFSKDKTREHSFITKHYVLPAKAGSYTAELRRSLQLPKRVVTGAAISADGKTVALLSYRFKLWLGFIPLTPADVFLFRNFPGNDFLAGQMEQLPAARCLWPTQFEAIDFAGPDSLYIASERTPLYRQKAKRLSIPLVKAEP
jgi:hypothetical protein